MNELRALTSVRGVAAWFVVLYHIRHSIAGLPDGAMRVFDKGYLAVDFFFLLSGFVIWLSWEGRFRERGLAAMPEFLKKRVARIWPLHLFVLAGAVLLASGLAATGRANPAEFPPGELPLHVLLLQNWGFTTGLSWNDPAWSISAELGAYLLFPFLTLAIDWRRVPAPAVAAALLALFVLLHATMTGLGAENLGSDITRFGLLRCVIEFAAGSAVCALWLRWRDRPGTAALASIALSIAILAAWRGGMPETLAVPAAFACALLALALTSGSRGNPLDARALHWLGEISYATYLGHFLLWMAFKLVFVRDPYDVPLPLIALYLAVVLASSAVLYRFVERPAQRWVNGVRLRRSVTA